jgi:hypothetical protein
LSIKQLNKIFLFITIFVPAYLLAQSNCLARSTPFKGGEEVIYDIEYLMGKTWVTAGKARFIVKDSVYKKQSCYYVEGKGRTLKNYDWFFKVRDKYASFISKKTMLPLHFIRRVREGEFFLNYDYDFNYIKNIAAIDETRKKGFRKDTINIIDCSFDIMSSVYFSRGIDFSQYKENDTIPMNVILDKEIFKDLFIIYQGKKKIIDQNNKGINCIHFKVNLVEGTIFKANESMNVFVSDDENRIPIYVEAEILVGAIRVYSKSIKGTKVPVKYLN